MFRRTFLALLSATFFAGHAHAQSPSRLIVLRHADRDTGQPVLNETGKRRAANLPDALNGIDIDAIFIPGYRRNVDSAAPLSRSTGVAPTILDPSVISDGRTGAEILAAQPSGTSVWIGNTDNLRALWAELDAPGAPPTVYGKIVILELDGLGVSGRSDLTYTP